MPIIKDKLYFNYDGVDSREFGIINVNLEVGMMEESLVGGRTITETEISGAEKPIFNKVRKEPKEFTLNLAFQNGFTNEKLEEVVDWLFKDYYRALYFIGEESKLFYCMPVGEPSIFHNNLNQGYVQVTMRCNSPYTYSPVYVSPKYNITDALDIEIFNGSRHTNLYPEISIEKIGDGHITLTNYTNGGQIFQVRNLTNLEKIYINSQKEYIETDIIGIYRFDNVIGNFPELVYGKNEIKIEGNCEIQFRYQYRHLF